jgi:hypothetical protein
MFSACSAGRVYDSYGLAYLSRGLANLYNIVILRAARDLNR